jgi:hypothetical protein
MTKESITIALPLPNRVLSPNCTIGSIGGRMMKAAATKKYRRLTREAVEAESVDSAPWRVVGVKATFFKKQRNRFDPDNAAGSLKAAYDGIVDAGLVDDDDIYHMKREMPDLAIDKENPRVMIEITRIE